MRRGVKCVENKPKIEIQKIEKNSESSVTVTTVDLRGAGRKNFHLEHLKTKGDLIRLVVDPDPSIEISLRNAVSSWCKRHLMKIKVQKWPEQGVFRLELIEGALEERPSRKRGPDPVNYPELAVCEVGEFFDYDYIYPPVRNSYMPTGLINAMLREKRKGRIFEYFPASAAMVRVTRVK